MTAQSPSNDATPSRPVSEREGRIFLLFGFLIFVLVLPLTLASQNSFLRSELVTLSQKLAAAIGMFMWVLLWLFGTINVIKKPGLARKGLRLLVAPLFTMLVALIFGIIALLAAYLVGNISVTVTADRPHRSVARILSINRTRGCQNNVTFYEPFVKREVHVCGDQFLSKPGIGESILVDEKISPWGVQIIWIKQTALDPDTK